MQFQTILFALLPVLALAGETASLAPVPSATGVSPTGGPSAPSNGTKPTAGAPKPTNGAGGNDSADDSDSAAMSLSGNAAGAFVIAIGAMAAGAMI